MSDIMFYGVLRMPYEMVMNCDDVIGGMQFWSCVQEAADRLERAEREVAELRAALAAATAPIVAQPVVAYGCHADLADDETPDGRVLDVGSAMDCVYATRYGKDARSHCGDWKPIAFSSAPAAPDDGGTL